MSCSGVLEARVTTERGVDDDDDNDDDNDDDDNDDDDNDDEDDALGGATHRALAPPVVGIVRFRPTSLTPRQTPPTLNPPDEAMDILAPCVCDALSECTSVRLVQK